MRIVLIGALSAFAVLAQNPSGNIVGRILDPMGASVPEAKVLVRHAESQALRQVSTDSKGDYTVAELMPGTYLVTVEKQGFRRIEERGITLQVDQTARLDFKLEVGSLSEVVEVQGSVPLLNTENSMKGDTIVSGEMIDIPLNGRQFSDLAFLVPGVSEKTANGTGSSFAVNGARSDNTNFIIDGFADRSPRDGGSQMSPPLDAMMEFKMQTTGYSSEYGKQAGGTMNMVLKSGTNRLHGAVFEFFRNDALDARPTFALSNTKLRRNQFGGTLDGPVYIPRLYNGKNRTFFLFTWEGFRQQTGTTTRSNTMTPLEKQGDFSHTMNVNRNGLIAIADPLSPGTCANHNANSSYVVKGGCFPGNVIPASRIDPIARKILPYYPDANFGDPQNNYYGVSNALDDYNNLVAKVDQRFGTADSFSFRFMYKPETTLSPFTGSPSGQWPASSQDSNKMFGLNYIRLFSPTLINEARIGLTRSKHNETSAGLGHNYAAEWGMQGSTSDPNLVGFPLVSPQNLMALGNPAASPAWFTVNNYQVSDTLTWVKARHTMRFGFELLRSQYFEPYFTNNRGTLTFVAGDGSWSGWAASDLELGYLSGSSIMVGSNDSYLFSSTYSFFAQDDYKLTPNLTLNLGVRYEIPTPMSDKYGRWSSFTPEVGKLVLASDKTIPNLPQLIASNGLTGLVGVAKDFGYPQALTYTSYRDFAPRFGFAWRPFGRTHNVIRGGYGIFYAANMQSQIRGNLGNTFPFSLNETFNENTSDPAQLSLAHPFATQGSLKGVLTPNGYQLHAVAQYVQSYNLTVERQIGNGIAIEIAFVGSKGTHLSRAYNWNQPYAQPGSPRPIPGYNDIVYYSFGANSIYNSGTFTMRKRFARGFFYRVNYVYGKSIDDASQMAGSSGAALAGTVDARNLKIEHGRSDWDRGHGFTALFMWDVPLHKTVLLRNWQLAGTTRMQTGAPFTILQGGANLYQGETARPDRLRSGQLPDPTPSMWYDKTAFVAVPAAAYRPGTSGRDILDGPGLIDTNFSLMRNFRVAERYKLQFRFETFNTLNHANYNLPNANYNQVAGATITGARPARQLQFGLRIDF